MALYSDFNKLCDSLFCVAPDAVVEQPDCSGAGTSGHEEEIRPNGARRYRVASELLEDWICYDAWPGPVEEESKTNAFIRTVDGTRYPATIRWDASDKGVVTWIAPSTCTVYSFELTDHRGAILEQKVAAQSFNEDDAYIFSFSITSTII